MSHPALKIQEKFLDKSGVSPKVLLCKANLELRQQRKNKFQLRKSSYSLRVMVYTCNPRTQETEAGGLSWVPGQFELQSKSLSENKNCRRIKVQPPYGKNWYHILDQTRLASQPPCCKHNLTVWNASLWQLLCPGEEGQTEDFFYPIQIH